jgi:hypothetical protein
MPAPLVAAGAKVVAKKVAAKQFAKVAAKKAAQGVAKKTAEKVGTEAVKSGVRNIPIKRPTGNFKSNIAQRGNITNKIEQAQNLKDNLTPKEEQHNQAQEPRQKNNFLDNVFRRGQTNLKEPGAKQFDYRNTFSEKAQANSNENFQETKKQDKG